MYRQCRHYFCVYTLPCVKQTFRSRICKYLFIIIYFFRVKSLFYSPIPLLVIFVFFFRPQPVMEIVGVVQYVPEYWAEKLKRSATTYSIFYIFCIAQSSFSVYCVFTLVFGQWLWDSNFFCCLGQWGMLPCGHPLCTDCVLEMSRQRSGRDSVRLCCPLCRFSFLKSEINTVRSFEPEDTEITVSFWSYLHVLNCVLALCPICSLF